LTTPATQRTEVIGGGRRAALQLVDRLTQAAAMARPLMYIHGRLLGMDSCNRHATLANQSEVAQDRRTQITTELGRRGAMPKAAMEARRLGGELFSCAQARDLQAAQVDALVQPPPHQLLHRVQLVTHILRTFVAKSLTFTTASTVLYTTPEAFLKTMLCSWSM